MSRIEIREEDLIRRYKLKFLPVWTFRYVYLLFIPLTPFVAIFTDFTLKEAFKECIDYGFAKVTHKGQKRYNPLKEKGDE